MLNADAARGSAKNAGSGHVAEGNQGKLGRDEMRTKPDDGVLVAARLDPPAPDGSAADLARTSRGLSQQNVSKLEPKGFALGRREVHLEQIFEVQPASRDVRGTTIFRRIIADLLIR